MNKVYSNNINYQKIETRGYIQQQKEYFQSGALSGIKERIRTLKLLRETIRNFEDDITKALYEDLRKPVFEAYSAEIGFLYQDIDHTLKNIKKWTKKRKVATPLVLQPATSWIQSDPLGTVLIIAPWNYPFQLALSPLITAVAAGNTAIIKPSEMAQATSSVIRKIIEIVFNKNHVAVIEGGVEITQFLLSEKFDHIFFTGSPEVGKIIMKAASENLTPVTLELGGKSPVIVEKSASIENAAKKIIWGKFLNAGQTCIAPDYILVDNSIKEEFLASMKKTIKEFYSSDVKSSPDYARIINTKHFHRLVNLMRKKNVVHGGAIDKSDLYIEPTLLTDLPESSPIMTEEIFGPLLPVQGYDSIEEAVSFINKRPKPLALYLFTKSSEVEKYVLQYTSSGGAVVNDTILHVANVNLPFGGVGNSGMGAYHGQKGFDTFSHLKSVVKRSSRVWVKLLYAPYKKGALRFIKGFLG